MDSQTAKQFFERAETEARRYGEDPWVFLRELVQNSRDAGASTIHLQAGTVNEMEQVTCIDDGEGMDADHFRHYFLRLYASSKETSRDAVGFFGVGFWSVLLFEPERIQVTSSRAGQALAFDIDCVGRTITSVPAEDWSSGTRIIIQRRKRMDDRAFLDKVAERLHDYCAYVRPAKRQKKLALTFNGASFNRPFPVPSDCGRAFKTGQFDGTLGFGRKPFVRIYKGGILVRDLADLGEVIPSRVSAQQHNWGLFANVHLNIEGMQVLMDRQKVYEDPVLHAAVRYCEEALTRLQRSLVNHLFPMNFKNRVFGVFDQIRSPRRIKPWLPEVGLLLLTLLLLWPYKDRIVDMAADWGLIESHADRYRSSREATQTLNNALQNWGGSIIDSPSGYGYSWDFQYVGPSEILFRMGTFSRYVPSAGFFPTNTGPFTAYPDFVNRGETAVRVTMGVAGGGDLILPLPPGYVLVKQSITGLPPTVVERNEFGEPVLRGLSSFQGTVTYDAIKRAFPIQPPPMAGLPESAWPAPYQTLLQRLKTMDAGQAVQTVNLFIRQNFLYTDSRDLAAQFRRQPGTWLEKTIAVGAGDCDILNGLLVLLMRSSGHQAFLSVGLVGDNGKAKPTLHAWARYFDNGWRSIDVTAHAVPMSGLPPSGASGAVGSSNLPALLEDPQAINPVSGGSPDPLPPRPRAAKRWWIPVVAGVLLLVAIIAFLLRKRRQRADSDQPAFVVDLFRHYFYHGRGDSELRLQYRPVFPLLNGRKISLLEMQQFANKGSLLYSGPDDPLLALLAPGYHVLNNRDTVVSSLLEFLPTTVHLHQLRAIVDEPPRHPVLVAAEGVIRELDPSFRVHQAVDDDLFLECALRFKDTSFGALHLIIGEQHPLFQHLEKMQGDPDLQVFEAVQSIMNKTTFYLNEKNRFLERLARRSPGWAGTRIQEAFQ